MNFMLPGLNLNTRATDHMVALISILGLIPLEFFHMSTFDCSQSKTYHDFSLEYGGAVSNAEDWRKHVTSAVKKWLLQHNDHASLVKCKRDIQGAIDVVGSRLYSKGIGWQGILNLNGVNYIISNGNLQCFYGDVEEHIMIGPRGIFDIVDDPSGDVGRIALRSCWKNNRELRSTLKRLKARSSVQ